MHVRLKENINSLALNHVFEHLEHVVYNRKQIISFTKNIESGNTWYLESAQYVSFVHFHLFSKHTIQGKGGQRKDRHIQESIKDPSILF